MKNLIAKFETDENGIYAKYYDMYFSVKKLYGRFVIVTIKGKDVTFSLHQVIEFKEVNCN